MVSTLGLLALLIPAAVAALSLPTATPQSVTTLPDVAKTITLAGSDNDGDTLTFAIASGPSHGSLGAIDPPNCDGQIPSACTATVLYTPSSGYSGPDSFTFTVNDNNDGTSSPATVSITVNTTPVATSGSNSTNEDNAKALTLAGTDADGDGLTFAIASGPSHGSLGSFSGLLCSGSPSSCTVSVTYTPTGNYAGSDSFTFTVNDGTIVSSAATFSLTVNAVNDAPSFTKGANQTVLEDSGLHSVSSWATAMSPGGGADEAGQTLSFNVSNNNNALFSAQPAVNSSGTLTFTPAANANGAATVTISIMDDGGTANGGVDQSGVQTFTITVTAVNDEPSFTKGANQTVLEDSGLTTVTNWATAMAPGGGADEAGQTFTFVISNNNNALFSSQPAVSPAGTLTFTPAANAFGVATVTVAVKDNGGTLNGGVDTSTPADTFTITVTNVNDAPSYTKGANQSVLEDAAAQTVVGWATAISAGPNETQNVSFTVTNNTNAGLFSAGPAVSAAGTLTYTLAANANGVATISLRLDDDGGTANGGVDQSGVQTFTITVTAVNDEPSFVKGSDDTVLEDSGPRSVPGWATNPSPGPADESAQTVTFSITGNTNSAMFSVQPSVASNGTLTYTPAANANGSATITVTLTDSGGTANGGNDSSSQTFNINVTAVNDPPIAANDVGKTVPKNSSGTVINVLTNDSIYPDSGETLTITGKTNGSHGTVAITGGGTTVTYTPAFGYLGSDSFTYTITDDGSPAKSDTATVLLTVIQSGTVTRLSGASRYDTSAAISAASFSPGVPVAYIATGLGFADALSGAPVAGIKGGPILLVPGTSIPTVIRNELTRLAPAKIVILGGTGAVSSSVATALAGYTTGTVTRLSGTSRYDTSAKISQQNFLPNVPVAYIATGLGFPDALSGAPVGGVTGGPILLVPGTSIPSAISTELLRLNPGRIVILGGTGVVSTGVQTLLAGYTSGTVTRLSGASRYDTSAAISTSNFAPHVSVVYIATGLGFPDALSGAPVAGIAAGPILLVPGTSIPAVIDAELKRLLPANIIILGGTGVVSTGVQTALQTYTSGP